jgi:hypothetical protein
MHIFGKIRKADDSIEKKIADLWDSAKRYQSIRIDDAGLIMMKLKADAGGIKAQAISDWVDALWTDYYNRKSTIEAGGAENLDFSNNSELPYGFYEAYAEEVT